MKLDELRDQINGIDEQMTSLFSQRMKLCADIAKFKQENGIAVLDASREEEVLNKIAALCDEDTAPYAVELYKSIFEISRSFQADIIAKERKDGSEEI